jgi:hypothetical protein
MIHNTYMVKKGGDYDVHRSHNEWLAQMDGGAGYWADLDRPLSMYIHQVENCHRSFENHVWKDMLNAVSQTSPPSTLVAV